MSSKRKVTGKATTIPGGIMIGLMISWLISILGAAVGAFLLHSQTLPETAIGYCSLITLVLAAALGSWVAVKKIQRLRFQMSLLTGVCYYISLLSITGLLFGGQYGEAGMSAIAVAVGSGLAVITDVKALKVGRGKLRKSAYR